MRPSNGLNRFPAIADIPRPGVDNSIATPIFVSPPATADNDAWCDEPLMVGEEIDAWARHALAANGFGDAPAVVATRSSERPDGYRLHVAARVRRSLAIGNTIVAAFRGVAALMHEFNARRRRWQRARETYIALGELDNRGLQDLGLDRSELRSLAYEIAGETERTRVRAQLNANVYP